jgi:apolipoprotein D and lipocalin family protein
VPNDRSNYWALDTDYENFAVVWQCQDLDVNQSRENYWLLSRTSEFPTDTEVLSRISAVTDNVIIRDEVRVTEQSTELCLDGVDPYVNARSSASRSGHN